MDGGIERVIKMRSAILVNDSEAFVACAVAGLGMIQAPHASVAEHLEAGRLVEVLPQVVTIPRPVSIMYPNRQYLPAQVRAFIDWISAIFEEVREAPNAGSSPVAVAVDPADEA